MGTPVDGDLQVVHGLEHGGLGLGRGAVDLVRQHDMAEDRAGLELERMVLLVDQGDAEYIGRQEVVGELDAPEAGVHGPGQGLAQQGLADAGHVLY